MKNGGNGVLTSDDAIREEASRPKRRDGQVSSLKEVLTLVAAS